MRRVLLFVVSAATVLAGNSKPGQAARPRLIEVLAKLPIAFEPNLGQTDRTVQYLSHGGNSALLLTAGKAILLVPGTALHISLLNANRSAAIEGLDPLPGKTNYIASSGNHSDIPTYARVRYRQVWPGIDLVFYGNSQRLEYDLVLASGADLRRARLQFEGMQSARVDKQGALILSTASGDIVQHAPRVYQMVAGQRREIAAHYRLDRDGAVTFALADYDHHLGLVIDPTLSYSTLIGAGTAQINTIQLDSAGNVYLAGTGGVDINLHPFPITPGAFETTTSGTDTFVAKLNPTGTALVYSTWFRNGPGTITGIAIDSHGNLCLGGDSYGALPVTPGVYQPNYFGGGNIDDAFLAKLNSTGSALVFATYFGARMASAVEALTVDSSDNIYAAISTGDSTFPITPGAFRGGTGAGTVVAKMNPNGTSLLYSAFIGAAGPGAIAVDSSGAAYVAGTTSSSSFPVTPGALRTKLASDTSGGSNPFGGGSVSDGFVTKINAAGTALVYSTFFGGVNCGVIIGPVGGNCLTVNQPIGIAVDSIGNAYLTGATTTPDFPVTAGAAQLTNGGSNDAFVVKLNATGSALLYSSLLGGMQSDSGESVAIDATGNIFVAGYTASSDFPITSGSIVPAFHGTPGTDRDAFVAKINPAAAGTASLVYSTFLDKGQARGVAVNAAGDAYITGFTDSQTFPTTPGAFQTSNNTEDRFNESFVAKITDATPCNPCSDLTRPTSAVQTLPPTEASSCFTVSWSGADAGSGIASYSIYASDNGGPFAPWLNNVSAVSALYAGTAGHTYSFFSVATDKAGNVESKSTADTSTAVGAAAVCSVTESVSPSILNFAYAGAVITDPQTVTISFSGVNALAWTASSNRANITVSPASGTGNATITVTAAPGQSGTVTVTSGAGNSPRQIQVNVTSAGVTNGSPFGSFDTPANNSTGLSGAIAVTGWALDNIEITNVDVWREKVGNETTFPNGLVFIGNAVRVTDARPDVQAANPNAPMNNQAGWGYLLLTTSLPSSGNGIYKLHAIAHNKAGAVTDLGTKTITVDNAHSVKPFGTVDTPDQGGTASGAQFVNFGWALAQNPNCIPTDGSTLWVTVDGVTLGHPTYNQARSDLTAAFPGRCNSGGSAGYYFLDTTKLTNGVHTISWIAYDDHGTGDGLGSRFFSVLNNTSDQAATPEEVLQEAARDLPDHVDLEELDRIELPVGAISGYLDLANQRLRLPIGSTLKGGVFHWQLGPGFHGTYPLVFLRPDGSSIRLSVTVHPKSYGSVRTR